MRSHPFLDKLPDFTPSSSSGGGGGGVVSSGGGGQSNVVVGGGSGSNSHHRGHTQSANQHHSTHHKNGNNLGNGNSRQNGKGGGGAGPSNSSGGGGTGLLGVPRNGLNAKIGLTDEVVMVSTAEEAGPDVSSIIYIVGGCTLGLMVILVAVLAAAYIRARKGNRTAESRGFLHV